ncbi:DUF695 domain-containing protein [Nibribacter ruber]|uniref:DUF695 domain-containing protein n=1 Tax=Nibribacter ruber TaxID=2698458 RepID=A0A6P1P3F5_9BACT|nr:DUF695 domain-containing protein [Nibribacter ruber]QHL88949.1 DUF695 domain-containing protein [Nibribacter ruber]
MRKILLGITIGMVVVLGFFGLSKNRTGEAGKERFPLEDFSILQANDRNGGLGFLMVNQSYKNYEFKKEYPWYLWVDIEVREKNANGHPTSNEATHLNNLEDEIDAELKKVCGRHYLGRTTFEGTRELLYYVDDPEKANAVLQKLASNPNSIRQFQFKIEEDKEWSKVAYLFQQD